MSRKTRKLMWSVPLIVAVAVIGALAAYVMLAPGGALAHSGDSVSTAHQPPGPVTRIDVTTPSIADGGRTMLRVSWNAPTGVDMPTMYRVDISKDTDVWMNVIGGEMSDDMLTDADAMADCTSDDNRNRCYTAPGLDSDTLYHFRVFAMNEFGTSPISVDETLGSGMTLRIDPPARVGSLDATDYYEDKIVVSWHDVLETGGADVLWYCIGVAASPSGPFTDLTLAAEPEDCLEAEDPTAAAMADGEGVYISPVDIGTLIDPEMTDQSQTIVVAAKDKDGDAVTEYEHLGLHTPDIIELRYRLYAVTDEDGDAETVDDRQISRAASETATGRTVRPSDKPDPRFESPLAVGNLRAVVYTTDAGLPVQTSGNNEGDAVVANQGLHFFWTHPEGYNPDYNDDGNNNDPNWYVQVQRRVAPDADHDDYTGWQFVTGSVNPENPLATGYGRAQFTVDFTATLDGNEPPQRWDAPVLWGGSKDNRHEYRVRYVNPGKDENTATPAHDNDAGRIDDVPGAWEEIKIPQVTTDYLRSTANGVPDDDSTLPIILLSTGNTEMGLRFEYNDDDPRDHIDLLWDRDENAREGDDGPEGPHGYVIDRSADGGATWEALRRADSPTELGTADTFTDNQDVTPGHQYTYRVFPVFIERGPDAYGVPALIDANSRGADLPTAARSVRAVGDGQNACLVTWAPPADHGGHMVRGYLIQIADDDDGEPGDWETIDVVDGTPPFTVLGGAMTEFKYTGTAAQVVDADPLSAGSVRWFRVIPVTNENDGDQDTGGAELNEQGGDNTPHNPRDATTSDDLPLEADYTRADPDKCTTEGLGDAPADKMTADPQKPVDLTAEAASDTNSLDPNDRGVFLTWNQQPQGDASKTTSYQINRIRMNTGVEALNDEADDWQFVKRVRDVTSYTDSTDLRRDEETRMYQVCSEASGVAEPVCVAMAVDYALHLPHMPDVPMDVMATAGYDSASDWWETLNCRQMVAAVDLDYDGDPNSETGMPGGDSPNADIYCAHYPGSAAVMGGATALTTEATAVVDMKFAEKYPNMGEASIITVTWDAPSDGGSPITGYMVQSKYGDMKWMDVDPAHMGTGAMYIDKNLMSATAYYYQVKAMNAKGDSAWSMMAMQTTENTDPMAEGAIEAVTLMAGDTSDAMDMSMYFSDADMSDTLTYTAMSDMEMYATVAVDGSMVTITGVSAGMATVTVTANDGKGGTAMQTIMVTVPNSAPMAEGSIEAVTLMAGDTSDAMDVSMYFSDADMSDTLTYTAMSDMEMYATVAVDGSMVTITGVSAGMATVTVTANDGKGGTAMQTIMVTVPNSAPMAEGSIEAVTLMAGDTSDAMDVSMYFSDADMSDTLTYTAMSDMEMYATVAVDGSMVTITGVAAGMATITVTATDAAGAYVMQTIAVTVNAVPMAVGEISAVTVTEGMMSDAMDVSGYFSDMGDTLTYMASSDMEMYATADIPAGSSMLTITGVAAGMATITVTATDAAGAYVMQTIMVTVEAAELGNAMGLTATAGSAGDVVLTWTPGTSATIHWIAGVRVINGAIDPSFTPIWHAAGDHGTHTVNAPTAGDYVFAVIAGRTSGGTTEWSSWITQRYIHQ